MFERFSSRGEADYANRVLSAMRKEFGGLRTGRASASLLEPITVPAYGGNQSLDQIRSRVPLTTRYLPFGHKVGFGMVARPGLDTRKALTGAHAAAYDTARHGQHGCQ